MVVPEVSSSLVAAAGPHDQGWSQVWLLLVAFALCSVIGLERELRRKSAGLRTHAIVGVGAALMTEVSKFGFGDVLGPSVVLDPSRVAAQIVAGIGFIGAGLIFVRGQGVRGLTTAAAVWLAAAVGMACGAGLVVLAAVVTALHLITALGLLGVEQRLASRHHSGPPLVQLQCDDAVSVGEIVHICESVGFGVTRVAKHRDTADTGLSVTLQVEGTEPRSRLLAGLAGLPGVLDVQLD